MNEFDIVGEIMDSPPVVKADGSVVTPATYLEGWHVNSTADHKSLKSYAVTPKSPARVYQGVKTYFYRFPGEYEAIRAIEGIEQET